MSQICPPSGKPNPCSLDKFASLPFIEPLIHPCVKPLSSFYLILLLCHQTWSDSPPPPHSKCSSNTREPSLCAHLSSPKWCYKWSYYPAGYEASITRFSISEIECLPSLVHYGLRGNPEASMPPCLLYFWWYYLLFFRLTRQCMSPPPWCSERKKNDMKMLC